MPWTSQAVSSSGNIVPLCVRPRPTLALAIPSGGVRVLNLNSAGWHDIWVDSNTGRCRFVILDDTCRGKH